MNMAMLLPSLERSFQEASVSPVETSKEWVLRNLQPCSPRSRSYGSNIQIDLRAAVLRVTLESGERGRNTDTKSPVTPKSTPQAEAKCKPRRSPQIQPAPCCGVKVHSPDLSPSKANWPCSCQSLEQE